MDGVNHTSTTVLVLLQISIENLNEKILKNSSMKHVTKDLKICSKQCIFNLGFSRYNIKKHRWLILMHTTVNLYIYIHFCY